QQRGTDDHGALPPVVLGDPHHAEGHDDQDRTEAQLGPQAGPLLHDEHRVMAYRARSAASTTLVSSIALVIGPTPPGTGARYPATLATSSATSPVSPASVRVIPTSTTAAPGLIMSAVISPGRPAAATTMSARDTSAARSRVPVWHSVTVAFSPRRDSSR